MTIRVSELGEKEGNMPGHSRKRLIYGIINYVVDAHNEDNENDYEDCDADDNVCYGGGS